MQRREQTAAGDVAGSCRYPRAGDDAPGGSAPFFVTEPKLVVAAVPAVPPSTGAPPDTPPRSRRILRVASSEEGNEPSQQFVPADGEELVAPANFG